jgi:membrane protein DedA with SNARE-associated domain
MSTLATLFVVVLLLNLVPAFAPPTWMAMSWVGFNISEGNPFVFAVVAASAATIGRLVLARFARSLMRGRLMRESDRENIGVVEEWLKKRRKLTVGAFFLYALGPLPSNFLFIAYGLSGLPLRVIGAAFFAGRTISYSVWAHLGRFTSAFIDPESEFEGGYLSGYFAITQLGLLGFVYLLTKLDWKMLIEQRKLKWRRPIKRPDLAEHGHTTKH